MKSFKMKNMKKGYFVGDFSPAVLENNAVELACKGASKYTLDAAYYRKEDTTVILIMSGRLDVDGKIYKYGDVLLFEPGDIINLFALTNVRMIVSHFPGTKKDLCRVVWDDFDKMNDFYLSYLSKITTGLPKDTLASKSKRIDSKDISVVIQGYYDPILTANSVSSVRKHLKNATVILSTWKECDCSKADYDVLVLSDDPGNKDCALYADIPIPNNGNRQILSSKAGLEKVKTKYTLRMRSDMVLLSDDILSYTDAFPKREKDYKIFSEKIIIGELYSRNDFCYYDPNGCKHKVPKPFHPSDWFYFGLTSDLKLIYDNIDLIPDNELADYTCKYPKRVHSNKYKYSWRYTSEQHIILGVIKKYFKNLRFEDWTDWDDENIKLSEKIMMNNFTVLNFCQHKILNQKYIPESYSNSGACYKEKRLMTNAQMKDYFENVSK